MASQRRVEARRPAEARLGQAYGNLPMSFEANSGQLDSRVKFFARGEGYALFLTQAEAVLTLQIAGSALRNAGSRKAINSYPGPQSAIMNSRACALRMKFAGAKSAPRLAGEGELEGKSNYFIGRDPRKWRTGVATYKSVRYYDLYPGIDLLYYGNQRQLEYDFIVAPGADPKAARVSFEGADRLEIDAKGELVIHTEAGEVRQPKPFAYQQSDGVKAEVACRYRLEGRREVAFDLGRYDSGSELVIDPVLSYDAYLGGSLFDTVAGIAVDAAGSVYVAGTATSADFPVTPGAIQSTLRCARENCTNVFVAKLNAAGTALDYSTYLGGNWFDQGLGITVDSSGSAYVTGSTGSSDFPITPGAYQTVFKSFGDVFVAKLNHSGTALVYSTYLGGNNGERGQAIAIDSSGNACVAGDTFSRDFPTTANALQPVYIPSSCIRGDGISDCSKGFVTKLNADGTDVVFSTYLSGSSEDRCRGVAVDDADNIYVTGYTASADFPTTPGAFLVKANIFSSFVDDGFVTKLDPAGSAFVYSTFIGGSGRDSAHAIAVDSSGNAYVTGSTSSTDFPVTPGSAQTANGSATAFKSTDGAGMWSASNLGIRSDSSVNKLVIDPVNPATLYAGTIMGFFKSTDAGSHWIVATLVDFGVASLVNISVSAIAIDPKNTSTLYVAGRAGFFPGNHLHKSTDGGNTWTRTSLTQRRSFTAINSIAIDPENTSTIYVATGQGFGGDVDSAMFKSTDGGLTWDAASKGLPSHFIRVDAVAINPVNTSTLYATVDQVYKSTNGGKKWKATGSGPGSGPVLVIDPLNPSTIYAGGATLYKSTNGGKKWRVANTGIPAGSHITALVIDPTNSSILYAGTISSGIFKSADGGKNWRRANNGLTSTFVVSLAIDPKSPATVYAGTSLSGDDAFVTKLDPAGSALVHSTYLGGNIHDQGNAIAIDAAGNAYVTGHTTSNNFPTVNGFQGIRGGGSGGTAGGFVAKLIASGSAFAFSTYLGGGAFNSGKGIAVDSFGSIYATGDTVLGELFPVGTPNQVRFGRKGDSDVYIVKIIE